MMIKDIRLLLSTLLITLPSLSHAFFCPTNFNQINFGDTIDQVNQTCGKPDKEEKKEEDAPTAQEWTYYIEQTLAMNPTANGQGVLKTTVAFDEAGKAISISVNGVGVGETTICTKGIQLGSTRDEVKAACGEPVGIVKQTNNTNGDKPKKKIVIYTYNSNPPQKLTFEDGKLTNKE